MLAGALVAAVVVLAGAGGGDGKPGEATGSPEVTSTTEAPPASTPMTAAGGSTATTAGRPAPTTTATALPGDGPRSAPWRAPALARAAVPAPFLEAWGKAKNRSSCGLLVPADAGPEMEGAKASSSPVAGDAGWDIYLNKGAGIVEILGLFDRSARPEEARPAAFSRRWSDGSVARYGPEDPSGEDVDDPEAAAFEAVLTLPDQDCAYRIYDTLGKSHLELVLERLRFAEGTV